MVAPVEHGDEEVERVVKLMNDLARPFFVLRAAHGLINANTTSVLPGAASQSKGARTRQRIAMTEIIEIIDKYVREE